MGRGLVVVFVALLVAGCGSSSVGAGPIETKISLAAQNGSGESGTATLTKVDDRTKVVIELRNSSAGAIAQAQPAHIHKGSCAKLDPTPAYALADIQAGKSTTTVPISLSDLETGAYAINVHKSAAQLKTYVACGNIGQAKESVRGKGYGY